MKKNPINKILAGLILIFSISNGFAQQDTILAKVGPYNITASEFTKRYELVPQVARGVSDTTAQKFNFLYSLIAEKLLSIGAQNLKLDTTVLMRTSFKALENMYVRDALFKNEILNKMKIDKKDIVDGLKKVNFELELKPLYETDSIKIYDDYKLLENGANFDSLVNLSSGQMPIAQIKYGEVGKPMEDLVYSLRVGDFTPPINSPDGWMIFKLLQRKLIREYKRFSNEDYNRVMQVVKDRATKKAYAKFNKEFYPGKRVTTNGDLFWVIVDKLSKVLTEKKKEQSIPDTSVVYLNGDDILSVEHQFGKDTLNMVFINFKKNPLTVQKFLRYFIFEGFYTIPTDTNILAEKLNSRIKDLIAKELLSREGYSKGLENQPRVESSINMWRDNYLSSLLMKRLKDSVKVSDQDLYNYYLSKSKLEKENSLEVNILEILTDSLQVVEKVLNDLKHGADFRTLARIHTERKWTRAKGGEFGYFPSDLYGDIGRIAATMKVGEVYGPLKVPQGYSIFKLIGKKENKNELPGKFENVRSKLREELYNRKWNKYLTDYIVKLADKYGVKINDDAVRTLKVKNLNMLTFRYMGFGGTIMAVPLTVPLTQWVNPWEESTNKQVP